MKVKHGQVLTSRRLRLIRAYRARHAHLDWHNTNWTLTDWARFDAWEETFLQTPAVAASRHARATPKGVRTTARLGSCVARHRQWTANRSMGPHCFS